MILFKHLTVVVNNLNTNNIPQSDTCDIVRDRKGTCYIKFKGNIFEYQRVKIVPHNALFRSGNYYHKKLVMTVDMV